MAPNDPESDAAQSRIAALEARLDAIERLGSHGGVVDRILRYLPWLAIGNLVVGIPAVAISLSVAYFAFVQANATDKMQVAAVWPSVSYITSNQGAEDGAPGPIRMALANSGVGPAIVRGLQVEYEGKRYVGFEDLLRACCASPGESVSTGIGSINGEVLRPGEEAMFAMVIPDGTPPEVFERFNRERLRFKISLCYCSVFDDCWVESWDLDQPKPVDQCPADWVQYSGFPQGPLEER
ncbi:hypothetical protein [Alteriqipengyuania lutimaris]|uniref:Uncharacterized protein n=1 Tax=Alteriqipengyuania lutimaris TaxID=1538146 RepID=A0A395LHW3_9SPHN|nr:hypothetical protein [Alteriqipengyuania lutimaris]MBB3034584.1 hypothetical protein [Alteriqipengyuania lutimaris]RDS76536.1 hypothetical protein DL238_02240 [Alteriqipengyuania lutimaris]